VTQARKIFLFESESCQLIIAHYMSQITKDKSQCIKIALCIMSWWVYGVICCGLVVVGRSVPESAGPFNNVT